MTLCFIEPEEAVRVVFSSVSADSRHHLLVEAIRAWVDEVPEGELAHHYSRVVHDMDEDDLSMLAAWHASLDVGTPIASREFLVGAFGSLGRHQRDALRIAAAFRGEDGFSKEVRSEEALEAVLPWLSDSSIHTLAQAAVEIYICDRIGTEN